MPRFGISWTADSRTTRLNVTDLPRTTLEVIAAAALRIGREIHSYVRRGTLHKRACGVPLFCRRTGSRAKAESPPFGHSGPFGHLCRIRTQDHCILLWSFGLIHLDQIDQKHCNSLQTNELPWVWGLLLLSPYIDPTHYLRTIYIFHVLCFLFLCPYYVPMAHFNTRPTVSPLFATGYTVSGLTGLFMQDPTNIR